MDRCQRQSALCKLQLGPQKRPDFKFELLPLHSPLLGQSLLVSFPPLIDMLKFSGYPRPIRGQPGERRPAVALGRPGGSAWGGLAAFWAGRARGRGGSWAGGLSPPWSPGAVAPPPSRFGPARPRRCRGGARGPAPGRGPEGRDDARTGVPPGLPGGAMCVQRFDGSLNSAIHITYRISLRSSSMLEPRDPLLKVLHG